MNSRLLPIYSLVVLSLFACRPESGTAVVIRVVDGDTLEAHNDKGSERFRLRGIDSAEYRDNRCAAETARRALAAIAGPGSIVRYTSHGRDRYDRLLIELISGDGGDLNGGLIEEGYAIAYRAEPATRDRYLALEAEAKARGRGLWDERCGNFAAAFARKGVLDHGSTEARRN